jgi:hypothetical protein
VTGRDRRGAWRLPAGNTWACRPKQRTAQSRGSSVAIPRGDHPRRRPRWNQLGARPPASREQTGDGHVYTPFQRQPTRPRTAPPDAHTGRSPAAGTPAPRPSQDIPARLGNPAPPAPCLARGLAAARTRPSMTSPPAKRSHGGIIRLQPSPSDPPEARPLILSRTACPRHLHCPERGSAMTCSWGWAVSAGTAAWSAGREQGWRRLAGLRRVSAGPWSVGPPEGTAGLWGSRLS